MGTPESEVTVFLRNGGRLLLERTPNGFDGLRAAVSGTVHETAATIADEVFQETGGHTITQQGDPVTHGDARVYPILLDVYGRDRSSTTDRYEWRHATALLGESGRRGAWEAYQEVAPNVTDIIEDCEHGSTTLSLRALEVLRDRAATGTSWTELTSMAQRLIDERGDLTALVTRVDRTMARAANGSDDTSLDHAAREEIDAAVRSDEAAAAKAAAYCTDRTVLTLSQSGTVQAALSQANPTTVILLESRPQCEAIPVAETLAAEGMDVSLNLDAAAGDVLCRQEVDVVLVGADTVHPNGDVRNKVGTRTLAMAANQADIPVIAATSSDKIAMGPTPEAWIDGGDVYDGPHDIDTNCRRFDRTSPELITELVTELGPVTPDVTIWIAAERRTDRIWRERPERLQSV